MPETYTDRPLLGDSFDRALALAVDHHRRQLRKGTEIPYVSHLLGVTSLKQLDKTYISQGMPTNLPSVHSAFPLMHEGY